MLPLIAIAMFFSLSYVPFFHSLEPIIIVIVFLVYHYWYLNRPSIKRLFSGEKSDACDFKYVAKEIGIALLVIVVFFYNGFPVVKMYENMYERYKVKKYDFNGTLISEGDSSIEGFSGIRKHYSWGRVDREASFRALDQQIRLATEKRRNLDAIHYRCDRSGLAPLVHVGNFCLVTR